jgi:cytochrome c peroxidase
MLFLNIIKKSRSFGVSFTLFFLSLVTSEANADLGARQFAGMFKPLPKIIDNPANPISKEKVELGEKLYHETALSLDNNISCNSCHRIDAFGVDNEPTSPGTSGKRGDRNSPSSFNAALHIAQFWDGRAVDVEEQALGPVLNPIEMAIPSEEEVIKRLSANKVYPEMFNKAFPGEDPPLSFKNIGKAIGAFERTLLTPSRFDNFLEGDDAALTEDEKKGMVLFVTTGCATCHNGVGIGGGMYQKIGLVHPWETKDFGRHAVTQNEQDKFFFKVPSLRNIEKTAPYYHDGSVKTLDEAVSLMAWHQLGRKLTKEETSSIVTFLGSLTGELVKLDWDAIEKSKN